MILCITPNPALDRIMMIDEFIPDTTMRSESIKSSVGGKAFVSATVLSGLGADPLALGILGGDTGKRLASLLEEHAVRGQYIWTEGETRLSHVIAERKRHRQSHVIAGGIPLTPDLLQKLLTASQGLMGAANWVIAAGSLPVGAPEKLYALLIGQAREQQVPILIDASGLPAAATLTERPDILKMNRTEFQETFQVQVDNHEQLATAAHSICVETQLPALVVTCGGDGILAVTENTWWWAVSPHQQVVNAAGAGDTVSAVLAWRFSLRDDWPTALRYAAAYSAASVLTEGTAQPQQNDVARILPEVHVAAKVPVIA